MTRIHNNPILDSDESARNTTAKTSSSPFKSTRSTTANTSSSPFKSTRSTTAKTSISPFKITSTDTDSDKSSGSTTNKRSSKTVQTTSTVTDDPRSTIEMMSSVTNEGPTSTQEKISSTTTGPSIYLPDCLDYANIGNIKDDGIYRIMFNGGKLYDMFCLNTMQEIGAGWTVFLRRIDEGLPFNRTFAEYEEGFGDARGNHWAGLKFLHTLTYDSRKEFDVLLVLVSNEKGETKTYFEIVSKFRVGPAPSYAMSVGVLVNSSFPVQGSHSCMGFCNNTDFSTRDRDVSNFACPATLGNGGWWWDENCLHFNPTGIYTVSLEADQRSMGCARLYGIPVPLKAMTMALRKKD